MFEYHIDARIVGSYQQQLFAVEKPADVMSHPNKAGICKNALVLAEYSEKEECYFQENEQTGEFEKLYLCNRLDAPTSGLILVTPSLEMAQYVKLMFKNHKIKKTYFAIVRNGVFEGETGRWEDLIQTENSKGNFVRSRIAEKQDEVEGKAAICTFRCIKRDKRKIDLALIELSPQTGLTHQLRVQCVKHRHPIVGDKTYGDFKFNRKIRDTLHFDRLALHSATISVPMANKQIFQARAPMPEEFNYLLGI